MKYTISIDVPSLDEGIAFYSSAFGFKEKSRPHPGYAVLVSGEMQIGLLAKPAGSNPAPGSADVRKYERHWTPVHADFRVEDFETVLKNATEAGAVCEKKYESGDTNPAVAFCSDPFGNGFCIVEAR